MPGPKKNNVEHRKWESLTGEKLERLKSLINNESYIDYAVNRLALDIANGIIEPELEKKAHSGKRR